MAKEYKTVVLKNKEKRYVFDVNLGYDLNGKRIRKTITSKTVQDGRTKVSELRLNHRKLSDRTLTFKEGYDLYLIELEEKVKDNRTSIATLDTKKSYRFRYKCFEDTALQKIDELEVEQWQKSLNNLKPKTRNCYENGLSIFFNWCIKKKIMADNPFKYLDKTKSEKKKLDIITEDEFKVFIKKVDDEEFKLLLVTLFYTGLRFSEVMALKNDNIIGNEIHVNSSRITIHLIESTKMKTEDSKRIVPIPSWLKFPIKKNYIFDKYKNKSSYKTKLLNYIELAHFRKFTFHDLRHSYVSMCIDRGVDIFLISKIVGHTNIRMTMNTYGHIYKEKRESVSQMFGDKSPF